MRKGIRYLLCWLCVFLGGLPVVLWGDFPASFAAGNDGIQVLYIDVDKRQLTLYIDGVESGLWTVAVGASETPTPLGVFRVTGKFAGWGGGFGGRFIRISVPWGKYGIHGTNKPSSIGGAVSHGCIRMSDSGIKQLYSKVKPGAYVIITQGDIPGIGGTFRTLAPGDRNAHVFQVQLRLQNLGFYQGPVGGIFGEGMKAAVLACRRALGLPASHNVDIALYKALGFVIAE